MNEPRRPVPPLWLERDLLGVSNEHERAELAQRCSEEERASARADHEALSRELLARVAPAEFAQRVRAQQQREARRTPRVSARGLLVAATAVALLALVGRHAVSPEVGESTLT